LQLFFALGLFNWNKSKIENAFKTAVLFVLTLTFLVAALSIPLFRYLHPVVPLVYIIAVGTLVTFVTKFSNCQYLISKQIQNSDKKRKQYNLGYRISNLLFSKNNSRALISFFLVFIFAVGQTLGVIFLDSRFERAIKNPGKPPLHVVLSTKLKEITAPDDVVITNLDTWGSWYGERKTVWYPLLPAQLDPGAGKQADF
jgi:hypothetical protein